MIPRTLCGIVAFALGLLLTPFTGGAQQPPTASRVGILHASSPDPPRLHHIEAFRQRLRELGYAEGRNVAIEARWAYGVGERLPALAAEMLRLQVDVIVTAGTPAALAAKQATTTIPIVLAQSGDPVADGLIASLGRPGGNVTGLSLFGPELNGKRLELLKEIVPGLSRVAVLYNPLNPAALDHFRQAQAAAKSLAVQLQAFELRTPDDLEPAFAAMAGRRTQAVFVFLDPLISPHRGRLAVLAVKHRLPAIYETREFAEAGGLLAYGPSLPDIWRRAADYVDRILKSAKPADLPVEQPTKFELVINLKTAKALGLTIPQSILIRADEVIQ